MFFSVIVAVTFAKVHILDTPGFTDSSDHQHQLPKKSIATHIQEHIATVNAVLILANFHFFGINSRTEHALSAFLPKTLANNVGILFTNTRSAGPNGFGEDVIPKNLNDAPLFLFDNPIAHQRSFLELTNDPNKKKARRKWPKWREMVKDTEQKGLEMLVGLFDWLDGREPLPTTDIVALWETSQAIESKITNTEAQVKQVVAMIVEVNKLVQAVHTNSVSLLLYSRLESLCLLNVGARGSGDN